MRDCCNKRVREIRDSFEPFAMVYCTRSLHNLGLYSGFDQYPQGCSTGDYTLEAIVKPSKPLAEEYVFFLLPSIFFTILPNKTSIKTSICFSETNKRTYSMYYAHQQNIELLFSLGFCFDCTSTIHITGKIENGSPNS